jgi:beta-D-xylosidase 4
MDHRALALTAARQGMVLVKNDNNALPLKKGLGTIAVVGPHCNATVAMQSNYHGTAPYIVSPADGLAKYAKVAAVQGCGIDGPAEDRSTIDDAVAAASSADATVIIIGLDNTQEGEGHDRCVRASLPKIGGVRVGGGGGGGTQSDACTALIH